MKKSIKYAGIAAATLLVAAPTVAPAFNGNVATQSQTAKASFSTSQQEDAYNAFDATWKDYNTATQLDFAYAGATGFTNNRLTYGANWLNSIVKPLHPQYQNYFNDFDSSLALGEVVFVVVPGNGESTSEWKSDMLAAAEHGTTGVSYRIVGLPMSDVKDHATWSNQELVKYFSPVEMNGKALDKTVTAKTEVATQEVHAMNINFDTPVQGYVGEPKSDFDANGKHPITITDNTGATVTPQDVTSTYFKGTDVLGTTLNASQLTTAGTVTQKMTVKFNRNEYAAILNDIDQINVNGQGYQGGLLNKIFDKAHNSVTLTRQINVGLDNYSNSDVNGVVTTPVVDMGNNTIVTHLYDENGTKIVGRALSQGTDWFTDTKRVNNNGGEVMYRVSTNEWVKASDVSYADKTTDTDNGGDNNASGLTDITDLPANSTVSLDGPAGFVYSLFTSDGTAATRGLAGLSSWSTDKTAKDAQGNVYYRVSTNEWIQAGSGVTLN
ncbi:SLAP domain-containing protein [Companilactobacillus mishanensis]|uniref:SLAP domain-containing protein n=1 Tax=Companilactobacillus mishanensis TaxID=2486008 RepID=UPI0012962F7B|nr:SLAP domain-containing protein [Companilactobacillus mishanensis]MQS89633.1 hypothetical protein [Companilactobacillus mishanensis]